MKIFFLISILLIFSLYFLFLLQGSPFNHTKPTKSLNVIPSPTVTPIPTSHINLSAIQIDVNGRATIQATNAQGESVGYTNQEQLAAAGVTPTTYSPLITEFLYSKPLDGKYTITIGATSLKTVTFYLYNTNGDSQIIEKTTKNTNNSYEIFFSGKGISSIKDL